MLDRRTTDLCLKAEDQIFAKLEDLDTGLINGAPVTELSAVGIRDYRTPVTSRHRVPYRKIENVTYVYAIAGHQQDFQTLLLRRLFMR
jgi:toxin ParE1/3/4